jgi:hypothetical protein
MERRTRLDSSVPHDPGAQICRRIDNVDAVLLAYSQRSAGNEILAL